MPATNAPAAPKEYDNRDRIGVAQSAANQVMNYLFELRQMQPLSIWWIILTLATLAVLLGPVDYWVLKRLDKQPFTWLTSAAWIAVFTAGAYYGVQWLRAGAMELRAVTVVDGIVDDILQRVIEIIMSFPTIPLWAALALRASWEQS